MKVVTWLRASRLASQAYIALPLLLGQAVHVGRGGSIDWMLLTIVQAFGLFDQLFIVYANDVADEEADRLNETYTLFSGGSRQLVDGALDAVQLQRAAGVMAALVLLSSLVMAVGWGRWLAPPFCVAGLGLLWAYSFEPIRLSYRGGGEFLQMIGIGFALPLFGYYAQSGRLDFPAILIVAMLPTQLACAIATSLPDEPGDRAVGKRTLAVRIGPAAAKAMMLVLDLLSVVVLAVSGWFGAGAGAWLALPTCSAMAQLLTGRSAPGSFALSARVFFALLSTLGLIGILAAELVHRPPAQALESGRTEQVPLAPEQEEAQELDRLRFDDSLETANSRRNS